MKHRQVHPTPVDNCFGCKVCGVHLGVVSETTVKERVMAKDLAAYKRLRNDGLQPPRTSGTALLEAKANHEGEIAAGRLI